MNMAPEDEHISYLPREILFDILKRLPAKSLLLLKSVCKLWHYLISDPRFIESHFRGAGSYMSLLTEINVLSRLPAKSLSRFKCVCKSWNALISDPGFIKSHLLLSTRSLKLAHHRLIFKSSPQTYLDDSLNDVFEKSINTSHTCFPFPFSVGITGNFRVVGSCNGLLCISNKETLKIYNPTTRILSKLYTAPFGMVYGFGYDDSSDDYKVVVITYDTGVEILSLKTGTWKKIGKFPYSVHGLHYSGKFANGALHWANHNGEFGSSNSWRIISLDLVKETYGEVLQPLYDKGEKDLKLGTLGHCLCVTCSYRYDRMDLWVMKVYGVKDSWTKLASIPYQYLPHYERFYKFVVPLCISNDGKVLLQYGLKLVIYDARKSSTKICRKLDGFKEIWLVVESLVSPCAPLSKVNAIDGWEWAMRKHSNLKCCPCSVSQSYKDSVASHWRCPLAVILLTCCYHIAVRLW